MYAHPSSQVVYAGSPRVVQGWEKDPCSPADAHDQPPSLALLWVEDTTGTGVLGHPGG